MEFELIRYNHNKLIRLINFLLTYLNLAIIYFCLNVLHTFYPFFKWSLVFICIAWVINNLFTENFNAIGVCWFKSREIFIIRYNKKMIINHGEIRRMNFYYGGYKGEVRALEIFYTGYGYRDGTKNFIEINGNRFQLLLKSKSDLDFIKNYMNVLNKKDIDAKFIKKY